jgi:hypothetical protein
MRTSDKDTFFVDLAKYVDPDYRILETPSGKFLPQKRVKLVKGFFRKRQIEQWTTLDEYGRPVKGPIPAIRFNTLKSAEEFIRRIRNSPKSVIHSVYL